MDEEEVGAWLPDLHGRSTPRANDRAAAWALGTGQQAERISARAACARTEIRPRRARAWPTPTRLPQAPLNRWPVVVTRLCAACMASKHLQRGPVRRGAAIAMAAAARRMRKGCNGIGRHSAPPGARHAARGGGIVA
ncbi:hypothetical protein [Pseudorhodoferax soli]|uniref:hypothetical protein n=1 Tax=Pseudorhodoferax soli TaxID=545864 RepID=UPI0011C01FC1|nr:hypothetical protein [Pseudorhodoferax soli]